jgi:MinD superfamily P-loop ATPase
MRQIVIVSGKGGTGKTVIAASFAALAQRSVLVDCDVDAADLHLLAQPAIRERHEFKASKVAVIDNDACNYCGRCVETCRFEAIDKEGTVDPVSCEGCGICSRICPVGAITMREKVSGEWYVSTTRFGPFVHAKLGVAEENSGKLVTLIRTKAKELAQGQSFDLVLIDGSPGIGCPVIASLSGVDLALVVTEPTLSGLHDAERIVGVARMFKVPVKMVVNKFDLNSTVTEQIEAYCANNDIPVVGRIPFDKEVVCAMVNGVTVPEHSAGVAATEIEKVWRRL